MPDPISWAYSWPYFAAAFAFAFLIGSIPTGLLLARFFGLGDIRQIGSGNIGATNVLRAGRRDVAALTLAIDAGKGLLPVLLAKMYGPDMAVTACLAAVMGHMFTPWLRFRGGKGVATGFAALVALAWPVGLTAVLCWVAVLALSRYVSVASLVGAAAAPAMAWYLDFRQEAELATVLAVLIWFAHRSNIRRLIKGEEEKIGIAKP